MMGTKGQKTHENRFLSIYFYYVLIRIKNVTLDGLLYFSVSWYGSDVGSAAAIASPIFSSTSTNKYIKMNSLTLI